MGDSPRSGVIRVFAPATVANFGPGFDSLGMAIEGPGDTIEARVTDGAAGAVMIKSMTGAATGIPLEANLNCAGRAAIGVFERLPSGAARPEGVELRIDKGIPAGSGLGSSGSSAVAAAVAVNLVCGSPLGAEDLLDAALEGEAVASGTAHADNVAPSLVGGFTIVTPERPVSVARFDAPAALRLVLVRPEIEIATREARAVLPQSVPLAAAAANWAYVGALVAAVAKGDVEGIGRAIVDRVIEPVRAARIPGFDDVRRAALQAGAHGCSISGSGPTVFAVATAATGEAIGGAMQAAFERHGVSASYRVSAADNRGARRID